MDSAPPTINDSTFIKADSEKIRFDLLSVPVIEELAKVLTFGARKYAPGNWKKCPVWSRYYRPALGHLFAWAKGEDLDPESGLSHLAHAMCCIMFLEYFRQKRIGSDNRDEM